MRHMHTIIAMTLAAALVAGCQGSATEDNPAVTVDASGTNPGSGTAKTNPDSTPASGGGEPLRLDSAEAAALLGVDDDPPEAVADADPDERVDNSRCLVCHGNFRNEELSVVHAAHGVGCEKCHGPSNAHCSDENNITPPDIMYPRDAIIDSCMKCHPADKLSRKDHHVDIFAPKDGKMKKVCTDCHGKHRIVTRDVRWNRKTGELIKGGWMGEAEK
ncbi:MAG: cytochrome c3 family protein [Phycisphaerae bacterium]